jgi:antitoxin component YwqK of YwqJK toxin-antitoxin module
MIKPSLIFLGLLLSFSLFSQQKVFVVDSIMNDYMESGYANKHFMPKGKYDKYEKRTGKWKDYEVDYENVFVLSESGVPLVKSGVYLVYGKGEFLRGNRIGEWKLYVLEDKSFKKIHFKTVQYRDGKEEGIATYHFPSSGLAAKANYERGELQGEFIQYYESGQQSVLLNFSDSKRTGKQMGYFPSGKLQWEKNYVEDSLDGLEIHYYENGNIQWSQEYKLGKEHGTYKYYHENGQVWTEKIYENDLLMEMVGSYTSSGEKLDAGTLKNGNGTVKYYKRTGEVYLIETYENGVVVSEDRSGEFDW